MDRNPNRRARFSDSSGFSLLELLLAMVITLGIGLIVFQMFLRNERVFRDQNMVLEMEQSVRAVADMINDELRMAGKGVPAFAASQNNETAEAVQIIMNGSNASTIVFRSSGNNGFAEPQGTPPFTYLVGVPAVLSLDDIDPLVGTTGSNVFLWGPSGESWTWVRATVGTMDAVNDLMVVVPTQMSLSGGTVDSVPYLSMEEGTAFTLNGTDVRRGTITSFATLTAPTITYETIGENFNDLTFTYYDAANNVVTPSTLAARATVRRVDFTVGAQTSEPLASTGEVRTYAITMSTYPRTMSLY